MSDYSDTFFLCLEASILFHTAFKKNSKHIRSCGCMCVPFPGKVTLSQGNRVQGTFLETSRERNPGIFLIIWERSTKKLGNPRHCLMTYRYFSRFCMIHLDLLTFYLNPKGESSRTVWQFNNSSHTWQSYSFILQFSSLVRYTSSINMILMFQCIDYS